MNKQTKMENYATIKQVFRLSKLKHTYEKVENITSSFIGVLMNQGATELTLILSLAHSHARFLVSWLIAPAIFLWSWQVTTVITALQLHAQSLARELSTFRGWVYRESNVDRCHTANRGHRDNPSSSWSFQKWMCELGQMENRLEICIHQKCEIFCRVF